MLSFLLRRAVLALLVCLTVLVISFALTRLSGDLAVSIAGPNATEQDVATTQGLRHRSSAADTVHRLGSTCRATWRLHAAVNQHQQMIGIGLTVDQCLEGSHAR